MRYLSRVAWTNVDPEIEPASPAEADWLASHRRWTRGWRSYVFPGVLLGYLFYVGSSVAQYSRGAGAICGYAILGVFAVSWLVLVRPGIGLAPAKFWTGYGVLVALFVAELPFARIAGFVMCAFIAIITVIRLGGARSAPVIAVLALGSLLIPVASRPGTTAWAPRSTA